MKLVSPSREDGIARVASEVAGGPAGTHVGAGRHGFWTAGAVLAVGVTVFMAVALLLRQHCRRTLWVSPDQFTHACYSDIPALVASGAERQPVGVRGLFWLLAALAPGGRAEPRQAFDIAVVVLAVAAVLLVWAVLRLAGPRPWDAALVAFSPVLLTASLVSLDLVAVALAVLGLLAFSRRRPWLAGALVGLAIATRPLAVLVLLALVLVALRAGRWGHVRRTLLAAAVAWSAVNVPVLLASRDTWTAYWSGLWRPTVGYGSVWLLPQLGGHAVSGTTARWLFVLGALVVVALVALFTLSTSYRPRIPVVVLLLVVGILVMSPVVPVQASLWVLPFAALAVPRWRDLLIWAGAEVLYDTVTWFYVYGLTEANRAAPAWFYGTVLVVRMLAMAWLAYRAVSIGREPWHDPVRSPSSARGLGRDDPAAGDLEDAPDALVIRFV
ncbi:MAG TPA: glycosyltransferase 87 family protein [Actinomycetales bacterium]|nr:glycosyltransferase 87 family protein [Actinomycetales bacterium]